jgi:transposase-like protein
MPKGQPLSTPQRDAIAETLRITHNANHAARLHGIGPKTAWRIAKQEGIALGKSGRPRTPEREAIAETLRTTHNAIRAAKLHGVALITAWRVAKQESIKLRGPGRPSRRDRFEVPNSPTRQPV